jgi:hypothetical protein
MKIFGIEFHGVLELMVDFDGQTERRERTGVGGFVSVGAGEPHVMVADVWRVGDREFALMDGGVGSLLRVVDAAEELMGLGVAGFVPEEILEHGCGLVDPSLLEQGIGLDLVGNKKLGREEESK